MGTGGGEEVPFCQPDDLVGIFEDGFEIYGGRVGAEDFSVTGCGEGGLVGGASEEKGCLGAGEGCFFHGGEGEEIFF